ncbi:MAG: hypothetical protein K8S98_02125 [Planctomycetes bacterium]|nr:hypothetical protein [Planctomycetota bacterium]
MFKSDASTLVPGDSNGVGDIFLRHIDSGTTTLISVGLGGAQANGESFSPSINADGSVIAFQSSATNLVPGDANGNADIFVWEAGAITRVSLGTGGLQADGVSDKPSVSGDGRYVAFESLATNLVVGDTNGASDIFHFDRVTGSVVRASVSSSGAEANGASHSPWMNDNGAVVAFDSLATNLVVGDTNASSDVFVRDLIGGATIAATVFSGLVGDGNSDTASISAAGQFVAFRSDASNLTAGDTNGTSDVFLADPWSQQIWRVTEGTGGVQGNGAASFPQLSPDGLFVAFTSAASNLVSGDTNARDDVFVHDVVAAKTKRISSDSYGVQGNGHSSVPSVAVGGLRTAFQSSASNMVAGDGNGADDVFVRRPHVMTWYVNAIAQPGGVGSSSDPFDTIHPACANELLAGDDVVSVAPGVYPGGIVLPTVGVTIRGESGAAGTIVDAQGTQTGFVSTGWWSLRSYTLEGLTIRNGVATNLSGYSGLPEGGAAFVQSASLSLEACIVEQCAGGAVYAEACDVQIHACQFVGSSEGGVHAVASTASPAYVCNLVASEFRDGGLYADGVQASVSDCTFLNASVGATHDVNLNVSSSQFEHGDVTAGPGVSLSIYDATFKNGRIAVSGAKASLANCVISGAAAAFFQDYDAGGIHVTDSTITGNDVVAISDRPIWFANCVIALNGHGGKAEALFHNDMASWPTAYHFDRCTIAENGDGVPRALIEYSSVYFRDSICWGNYPPTILLNDDPFGSTTVLDCVNSDVEFPAADLLCIDTDPLFWDPAGGDYHLLPDSPCVGMGAVPFDPNYCGTPRVYCTAKANSLGCVPTIGYSGLPRLSGADDFTITATSVLSDKWGMLAWGLAPSAAPFGGGTLCIAAPVFRGPPSSSGGQGVQDCSGSYTFPLSHAYMAAQGMISGTTVYAQVLSRDPGFSPPNSVGLTDALRVVVCP